jgi:uncharacterized protein (TIGR03083 family)
MVYESAMIPERITRPEARRLAEEEFRRFAELMSSLHPDEWELPTDCALWNVRQMALHVLGAADAQASVKEFMHQMRRGRPLAKELAESHHWVDGVNELQIRERSHLADDEIVEQLATVGPRAVKGRFGTPLPMRYLPIPIGPPLGWKPLNYLLEVGFTRDVLVHRIDIAFATGRELAMTPEHEGRLIGDIVAEWAELWDQPFELVIEGPAGGKYSYGVDGERVEMDAMQLVSVLAEHRESPGGVLAKTLPM